MLLRQSLGAVAFGGVFLLAACSGPDASYSGDTLAEITDANELVVVTASGPTSYALDENGAPTGYEVALTQAFAAHLGVPGRSIVGDDLRGVLAALAGAAGQRRMKLALRLMFAFGWRRSRTSMRAIRSSPRAKPIAARLIR